MPLGRPSRATTCVGTPLPKLGLWRGNEGGHDDPSHSAGSGRWRRTIDEQLQVQVRCSGAWPKPDVQIVMGTRTRLG